LYAENEVNRNGAVSRRPAQIKQKINS